MRPQQRAYTESAARRNAPTAGNRANITTITPDSPVTKKRQHCDSGDCCRAKTKQQRAGAKSTARRNAPTAGNRANITNVTPDSPVTKNRHHFDNGNCRAKTKSSRAQIHQRNRMETKIQSTPKTGGGAKAIANPSSHNTPCAYKSLDKSTITTTCTQPPLTDLHKKSTRQKVVIKYTQQKKIHIKSQTNGNVSIPTTYKKAYKIGTQYDAAIQQPQHRCKNSNTIINSISKIRNINPIYTNTISQQSTSAAVKLRNSTVFPKDIQIKKMQVS